MVVADLPAGHMQRHRTRGFSRHVIWIVPIAVLSLLPLIAMKLVVGGRVGQMEDKIAEAQELLLESEEKAVDLDKALRNEKAQRVRVENELQKVRAEKEEHHRQIVKQMHAIGELKATSQAEKSASEALIKELRNKLDKADQNSGNIQQQLAAERAHEKRLVGIKSDELESYHQLIVKQRKEIERKNVIIARLADDRSRAVPHTAGVVEQTPALVDAVTKRAGMNKAAWATATDGAARAPVQASSSIASSAAADVGIVHNPGSGERVVLASQSPVEGAPKGAGGT